MIFCPAHRSTSQAARACLDFYSDSVYFHRMRNAKVDLHIDRSQADSWCAAAFFNSDSVSCFVYGMTNYRSHAVQIDLDDWWLRSFKFTDDRDDRPHGGRQLSVFKPLDLHGRYPQQGRKWGSPWSGTRRYGEDTRHEIYTGSGSQSSYPTSCLE
jgi:hypothetical protein